MNQSLGIEGRGPSRRSADILVFQISAPLLSERFVHNLLNQSHIGRARLLSSLRRFEPRLSWERGRLVRRRSEPHPIGGGQVKAARRRCHFCASFAEAKPMGRPQDRGSRRAAAVRTTSAPQVIPCLTPERHGWDAAVSPKFQSAGPDPVLTHDGSCDGPIGLKTCTTSHGHRP